MSLHQLRTVKRHAIMTGPPRWIVPLKVDAGWAWVVCFVTFVWATMVGGVAKVQGILFVEYLELFRQGESATSWIGFANGIMLFVTAPIGGYTADVLMHSRKRVAQSFICAIAVLSLALAAYLPNLPLTIFVFGCYGTCVGLGDPLTLSFISLYFDEWRTIAYGIMMIGASAGGMVLPLVFTSISESYGFRGAFLVISALWLHTELLPTVCWPISRNRKVKHRLETAGNNAASQDARFKDQIKNGTEMLKRENSLVARGSTPKPSTASTTSIDVDLGISNEKFEEQSSNRARGICSVLNEYKRFFGCRGAALLVLSTACGLIGYIGGYFLIPLLAQERGLSKAQASYILTAGSVLDMVVKVPVGILVDKAGVPKGAILVVSHAITGIGGFLFSYIDNPYALYGFCLVIGGFGSNFLQLAVPLLIDVVGDTQAGIACGTLSSSLGLGIALSPVIFGAVKQTYGLYVHSMRVCSGIYLLAIAFYCMNFITDKIIGCMRSRKIDIQPMSSKKANQREQE